MANSNIRIGKLDILQDYNELNALKPPGSFDVKNLAPEAKMQLSRVGALTVSFEVKTSDRTVAKQIATQYEAFFTRFVSKLSKSVLAIAIEPFPKPKTRIRTYKGFFSKSMKSNSNYVEVEVSLDENQSQFIGIASIEQENIGEYYNLFFGDSDTSCLIVSKSHHILTEDFANMVPMRYSAKADYGCLDYAKLVASLLPHEDAIIRYAGDGGTTGFDCQVFAPKHTISYYESMIEALLLQH